MLRTRHSSFVGGGIPRVLSWWNGTRRHHSIDLAVLGAGPGGYSCAVEAARLGMKVAVIEKEKTVGGTCLNVGCIPSKSLLHSSSLFSDARSAGFLNSSNVTFDLPAAMKEKDKAVNTLTGGIDFLFKRYGIQRIHGVGSLVDANSISVANSADGLPVWGESRAQGGPKQIVRANHIVIATGSEVVPLPGIPIDETRVLSSTGALSLPKTPKRMVVVGAGVIGLELGSVWARLGTDVKVVEFLPRILPPVDGEIARTMQRILESQRMSFMLGSKVTGSSVSGNDLIVSVEDASGSGKKESLRTDVMLVAIGRRPRTKGIGLERVGVSLKRNGEVEVDRATLQTAVKNIYAIGDSVFPPWLAHKAEIEGISVARRLAGIPFEVDYSSIPAVVYTHPEISGVGLTEEDCSKRGIKCVVGKSIGRSNPRNRAIGLEKGMVKVVVDKSGKILGVHILGLDAGELISSATIAMYRKLTVHDLEHVCIAHPSFSEALKDAVHDAVVKLSK